MGKFQAGDIVRLKSGGPAMVVKIAYVPWKRVTLWGLPSTAYPPASAYGNVCIWQGSDGHPHESAYPDDALEVVLNG